MINDLKAIAIFAETIKQGTFSAAAKTLNYSPSVVSYHISQLEERLGTTLIYRSTRKISLTAEGEILFKHATEMMNQAEQGVRHIGGHDIASGRLTVTLPLSATGDIITTQLAEFSNLNPSIEINSVFSDERLDLITEGIDIAFTIGNLPDSNFNVRKIAVKKRSLVCSPEYFKKHPNPTKPQDLANWNWIKHGNFSDEHISYKDGKKIKIKISGNIIANYAEALVKFAICGLGLTTVVHWLVEDALKDGRLIEVLPEWEIDATNFYAVWHGNISKHSNTRRLLNFLQDHN